jgi:diguanylate cyclase (GGDEF)-like protein/PAS domain S-box-containing protein
MDPASIPGVTPPAAQPDTSVLAAADRRSQVAWLGCAVLIAGIAASIALAATVGLGVVRPEAVLLAGLTLSAMAAVLTAVLTSHQLRGAELRSQQALLASVVANASDAIIIESHDGTVLGWNRAAEVIFGYPAADALGRPLAELILTEDREFEDAAIRETCARGLPVAPRTGVRRRRDGTPVTVSLTASPVTGPAGTMVAVAKILRELDGITLRLIAAERDLRAIAEALPSMIAYWDRDLVNRFANQAHQRWHGLSPFPGMRLQEFLGDETFERHRPHIEAVLRGETVEFEQRVRDVDDGWSDLQTHYIPDLVDDEVRGFYVLVHDITGFRRSEQRAADSEQFLEQAGAVSGVGGFRIDLHSGRQVWTRQSFCIFEIDGDTAPCAEDMDKLMEPEVAARLWRAIRTASESGVGYDLELPQRTARGRPIWVRTVGVVEFDGGRPARVVGAIQDITDRRKNEEALRTTSDRFALAAEAAGIGVWEWDLERGMLRWDEQMHRLYGRAPSAEEFPAALWSEWVHPEDRAICDWEMERALVGDLTFNHEFRVCLPGGAVRHLRATAKVQRDAAGKALRIVGIDVDVTAAKLSERALVESEAKFRTLFELSPVGIALTEMKQGRFLHLNDALAAPTGYSREELLGMTFWDLTPDRHHAADNEQIAAAADSNRFGPYEKEYRRKDGSTYPVLLSGIHTLDAAGNDVAWCIIQDISQRKAMESALADAARRDKLTGLANRAVFIERLDAAVERVTRGAQAYFAVLFIDFDRFKLVNDTLGHEAGDRLLRQIAERLRSVLRTTDALTADIDGNVVSRFGGDEFLILINDLKTPADAVRIAERLLNGLAAAYPTQSGEVHSTASIGIVTSDQCCTNAEEVVRNADVAMYEAKRAGRACSVVFNEVMHTRLTRHVTIENGLRRAIGTPELYLVYQPIVDLATRRTVSAEALLRWQHPVLGDVSPAEFIPIAEETGLIVALGRWVQDEACRAMMAWHHEDPAGAPATISVNVSRAELALGPGLLTQVQALLERHGLPPGCLQLEVTEREIMRNPEAALALMRELKALGVKLAMDDFGTGTSSLGCLRNYPFDTIKIDRSFLQDVTVSSDVLAVIHATVNLVENLGMSSLAEGVEDSGQVAVLQSLGCRFAQGWYFSRPVTADRFLSAAAPKVDCEFA